MRNSPDYDRRRSPTAGLVWTLLGFAILLAVLMYGTLNFYQEQHLISRYSLQSTGSIEHQGLFRGEIHPPSSDATISYDDPELRQVFFVLLTFLWLAGLFLALRIRHKIKALSQFTEQELREQAERAVHDLKSPLSALKMIAEYPSSLSPNLKPILQGAADRVEKIIQELEYRALAKAASPAEDTTPFLLLEAAQDIVTELRWNKKFSAIICKVQPPLLPITVQGISKMEFERHLMNLLVNAMESCLEGASTSTSGEVEVSFKETSKGGALVLIQDNGVGLSPDHLRSYFQRGFSSKKGRLRGRGLYYAQKFARGFGGELTLQPRQDEPGAMVTFHIPKEHIQSDSEDQLSPQP